MKVFLAVFDGFRMAKSTLEYSLQLARSANAHLTGLFLDEFIYKSYNEQKVLSSYDNPEQVMKELDAKDKLKRDESVKKFQRSAEKAGISYSVTRTRGIALQELKQQSLFADMIIINKNETFTKQKESTPTRFLKETISGVSCPILVTPQSFRPVDKTILLYDGGPTSIQALKMYSYIFDTDPFPAEVLTIKESLLSSAHLPNNKDMRKYIKIRFPGAGVTVEKGNPEEIIPGYLRNHQENELVVLGAYRRSELSRWFRTSMADILMKELNTPLFIAHNI